MIKYNLLPHGYHSHVNEQKLLIRLLSRYGGFTQDDFDRWFQGRDAKTLKPIAGDSYLLGIGDNGLNYWAEMLDLLQAMASHGIVTSLKDNSTGLSAYSLVIKKYILNLFSKKEPEKSKNRQHIPINVPIKMAYVRIEAIKNTRNKHYCLWTGCNKQVAKPLWGCHKHWFTLPKELRDSIWEAYPVGVEKDTRFITDDYALIGIAVKAFIDLHRFQTSYTPAPSITKSYPNLTTFKSLKFNASIQDYGKSVLVSSDGIFHQYSNGMKGREEARVRHSLCLIEKKDIPLLIEALKAVK